MKNVIFREKEESVYVDEIDLRENYIIADMGGIFYILVWDSENDKCFWLTARFCVFCSEYFKSVKEAAEYLKNYNNETKIYTTKNYKEFSDFVCEKFKV